MTQTCANCGGEMEEIGEQRRIFEPDPETMSEGQLAEAMAADNGYVYEEGVHGTTVSRYKCNNCGRYREV